MTFLCYYIFLFWNTTQKLQIPNPTSPKHPQIQNITRSNRGSVSHDGARNSSACAPRTISPKNHTDSQPPVFPMDPVMYVDVYIYTHNACIHTYIFISYVKIHHVCLVRLPPVCHQSASNLLPVCLQSASSLPPRCLQSAFSLPHSALGSGLWQTEKLAIE